MNCSKCFEQIIWLKMLPNEKTPNPKPAPIEMKPHPRGNLIISWEKRLYRFATPEEKEFARANSKNLYISHYVTCPFANEFRKKKK